MHSSFGFGLHPQITCIRIRIVYRVDQKFRSEIGQCSVPGTGNTNGALSQPFFFFFLFAFLSAFDTAPSPTNLWALEPVFAVLRP